MQRSNQIHKPRQDYTIKEGGNFSTSMIFRSTLNFDVALVKCPLFFYTP